MVEQQGQYIRTTLPTIKEFAPHMIDVDKLFSFHQSLPPTTTMAATPPQASDGGLSYPTPAEKLFTFPQTEKLVEEKVEIKPVHWSEGTRTTESNDTDFLVAHFDTTATTSVPSLSTKTEIQSTTPVSSLNESTTSTATNEETFAHPYAYLVSTTESPPAGGDVNSTLIPISATIVTIEMPGYIVNLS
jgi:hypothetical protein